MKRALLFFVVAMMLAAAPAQASAGALAGLGEITPPGCAQGALKMPIAAHTDGGPLWVAVRPASLGVYCPAIVYGTTIVFAGSWDPSKGGCVASVSHPGIRLCIGAVASLRVTATSMSLCFPTLPKETCWPGSALLART